MKKLLLITAILLSGTAFSDEGEGKELHQESCVGCHMIQHDEAFYTRSNSKMHSISNLGAQVSRCAQNFSTGWFPEEEKAVVDFLNKTYYKFH
ncbi:MAG: hypothetical protein DSY43_00570 [Gammaproteobacteria bacterium]|uniref:Cytochrome c n=1 Tax=endosymbiont of Bathymodiolus septemdierum str. Myojin knoll TaxID=1303921 RepID=A0A0P0URU0_9GAMM|nr:hypothetical protein [Bathymodiolus septemdierum thioautotrophic gill symbiont]RUA07095.1 MAG: hypothetical protein DSY43_00570 [Gammaproteobacteria bacterium]BAS67838.1 conserved hypothetical protein [endosymbiont of Bathymodiolus septemdierum str. Myojin knoll]